VWSALVRAAFSLVNEPQTYNEKEVLGNPEPVWTFRGRETGRKSKLYLTTFRVASINSKFYLNLLFF